MLTTFGKQAGSEGAVHHFSILHWINVNTDRGCHIFHTTLADNHMDETTSHLSRKDILSSGFRQVFAPAEKNNLERDAICYASDYTIGKMVNDRQQALLLAKKYCPSIIVPLCK